MIRDSITKHLKEAIVRAQNEGLIPQMDLPEIVLEHPQNPEHGDYAATIAMKMAKIAKMNPFKIAEAITGTLPPIDGVESVSAVRPGFINFVLSHEWLTRQVNEILSKGDQYGNSTIGHGIKLQLEFVSVNPTGPLHVGHGRGAVLGSTLANILSTAGYSVEKEYYINDAGNQMENFYASLYARYREVVLGLPAEMPPDGYFGKYMIELAREFESEKSSIETMSEAEAKAHLGKLGLEKMLHVIDEDLKLLGVEFDNWFSEQTLYDSGQFENVMALLQQDKHVEEQEGAQWFVSTNLGEDKDNVLVKSNGLPTYFAADIAYHYNKFKERGFDRVIDIWGADHQGHVSRLKTAMEALGISSVNLDVLLSQMVSLRRGEEVVKVSKRTGDIITLREVIEEVGADVCRFFFLARSANSQMDFDLELAKKQSMDNPVYYVQYGHARIAGIMRLAQERGIDYSNGNVSLLVEPAEVDLIKVLTQFSEVLETVAKTLEPQHLPYYAQELATSFHNFYEKCRVITEDDRLAAARLKLVEASRIVMAKALHLMGMNAPERM